MILSEIKRRNPYENRKFFLFLSTKSLFSLLQKNFILYNKDKSAISFSLLHNIPQNNHNWELLYPIRITLDAGSLYEKYPSLEEKSNKIIFMGKKIDLLKHILSIEFIADIKLHLPMERMDSEYIKLVKYLFNKLSNFYSFEVGYVSKWDELKDYE